MVQFISGRGKMSFSHVIAIGGKPVSKTPAEWLLEHAEVTPASLSFVWEYWTDVTYWDDPPAEFLLEGPFESGVRGMTALPDSDPMHWTLRDVQHEKAYCIETDLSDAVLIWEWSFTSLPDGRTRLRQRIGVTGAGAEDAAAGVRQAFGPSLADGMRRVARLLAEASARSYD